MNSTRSSFVPCCAHWRDKMRRYVVVSLAVLLAPCLAAQQRDSTKQPSDTADAERLRSRIEQAFSDRVQRELSLTPDQTTKLRASQERFSTRRRQAMEHLISFWRSRLDGFLIEHVYHGGVLLKAPPCNSKKYRPSPSCPPWRAAPPLA